MFAARPNNQSVRPTCADQHTPPRLAVSVGGLFGHGEEEITRAVPFSVVSYWYVFYYGTSSFSLLGAELIHKTEMSMCAHTGVLYAPGCHVLLQLSARGFFSIWILQGNKKMEKIKDFAGAYSASN